MELKVLGELPINDLFNIDLSLINEVKTKDKITVPTYSVEYFDVSSCLKDFGLPIHPMGQLLLFFGEYKEVDQDTYLRVRNASKNKLTPQIMEKKVKGFTGRFRKTNKKQYLGLIDNLVVCLSKYREQPNEKTFNEVVDSVQLIQNTIKDIKSDLRKFDKTFKVPELPKKLKMFDVALKGYSELYDSMFKKRTTKPLECILDDGTTISFPGKLITKYWRL